MEIGKPKKVGKSRKRLPKREVDEPIPIVLPEKPAEKEEEKPIPVEIPELVPVPLVPPAPEPIKIS